MLGFTSIYLFLIDCGNRFVLSYLEELNAFDNVHCKQINDKSAIRKIIVQKIAVWHSRDFVWHEEKKVEKPYSLGLDTGSTAEFEGMVRIVVEGIGCIWFVDRNILSDHFTARLYGKFVNVRWIRLRSKGYIIMFIRDFRTSLKCLVQIKVHFTFN